MPLLSTVLIIEDDVATQQVLSAMLHRRHVTAICTGDGGPAMELVARQEFGAILLDLLLPTMSGFEVLRQLASQRPELLSRIIVITAAHESVWRDCPYVPRTRQLVRKPFEMTALERDVLTCCDEAGLSKR